MNLLSISIIQLSKYKVFLGHSILNALITSSWLIFSIRGQITILNLFNTLKMLKSSYVIIRHLINKGFPIWFINFDLTKEDIIKKSAADTGEFYVTRRWIRGLVSNFYYITKAFRYYLVKKEFVDSNKVRDVYDKWFFTRFAWPRALFISNEKNSNIFYRETIKSKVITIGLVDVNIKSFIYNVPVACNDDSLESINFMNNVIAQYIIQCKYKKVLIWYFFNRNIKKYQTIIDWLKVLVKKKKKIKYRINLRTTSIPPYMSEYLDIRNSFKSFFSRSYIFKLFENKKKKKTLFFDQFYDIQKSFIYNKFNVLSLKVLSRKYKIKYRRRKFLRKIEGLSLFKSFLNNYVKLVIPSRRFKRYKSKKKMKMSRRKVTINFKSFFYFIFFYYLNKFNVVIDSYNRQNYNLYSLVNIFKFDKKIRKYKYRNINTDMFTKKLKYSYIFRYKSKKFNRKRRLRKYGSLYDSFQHLNKNNINMAFLFFYWKFLIIFLGIKLRSRQKNINFKLKKLNILKKI